MRKNSRLFDEELLESNSLLKTEDHRFQMKVYETIELLQDACPVTQTESTIRRSLARFGEAYIFFNHTGELCFYTDFVESTQAPKKSTETFY